MVAAVKVHPLDTGAAEEAGPRPRVEGRTRTLLVLPR